MPGERVQRARRSVRRGRGERGVLATVIVLPVVLLACWLALQAAFVMHAQHLAQVAAQDGAAAGAIGDDAGGTAAALLASSNHGVMTGIGIGVRSGGDAVTVTVTADVVRIFPFGSFSVSASGSAPIEEFIPQPERP